MSGHNRPILATNRALENPCTSRENAIFYFAMLYIVAEVAGEKNLFFFLLVCFTIVSVITTQLFTSAECIRALNFTYLLSICCRFPLSYSCMRIYVFLQVHVESRNSKGRSGYNFN